MLAQSGPTTNRVTSNMTMLDTHFNVNLRPSYGVTDHFSILIIYLWTKSHGATIQIKSLLQNFWTVLQLNVKILQKEIWNFCEFFTIASVRE